MSKEGATRGNPIRFRNSNAVLLYEKGNKAFSNQTPNTYVIDAMSHTYVCTAAKSAKGEPIWGRINDVTGKPVGSYVLISTGESGTKPVARGAGGKKISYTLPAINKRLNIGRSYDKVALGSFIFITLSQNEKDTASYPPAGSTTSSGGTVNSQVGASEYSLITSITNATALFNEAYNYQRVDSNGRSGFGATAPRRTIRVIVGRDGLGNPIYEERVVVNRTDANGNSGFGAGGQVVPAPSGSSNPSSGSGSSGRGRGGRGSSANPSTTRGSSPGPQTVEVNFLPDVNIYNGTSAYNGFQDKPYMQQTITDFNSINSAAGPIVQRRRIIRRQIFDIIPNSFEFSQLSSTWNEVERSGNYAMVDWSKYNLTKCSFRFLVAGRRTDTIDNVPSLVNDGMDVSIDAELENIRAIAGAPHPIVFNNLNKFLTKSYRFPYIDNTRNIQWVIADLSISATRLTPNGRGIAAAEVSITLNEYPIIGRDIIPLPPLVPDNPTTRQCVPTAKNNFCKPKTIKDGLFTDDYTVVREDNPAYGQPN